MITIQGRNVNNSYRVVEANGDIMVTAKGKEFLIPYTYVEKSDSLFNDYDKDLTFKLPEELEKAFDEDTIDDLKEQIEEQFEDLSVI
jgi:hypothetical protein